MACTVVDSELIMVESSDFEAAKESGSNDPCRQALQRILGTPWRPSSVPNVYWEEA